MYDNTEYAQTFYRAKLKTANCILDKKQEKNERLFSSKSSSKKFSRSILYNFTAFEASARFCNILIHFISK